MMDLKKGDKIILGNLNEGCHPTNPRIQVCSSMKMMKNKVFTVEMCSNEEQIFKVEGSQFYFSFDHIIHVVESSKYVLVNNSDDDISEFEEIFFNCLILNKEIPDSLAEKFSWDVVNEDGKVKGYIANADM